MIIGLSLLNQTFRRPQTAEAVPEGEVAPESGMDSNARIHMDLESDTSHLPVKTIVLRATLFFGYLLSFMGSTYLIGLIPTLFFFVIAFMRIEMRERWTLVLPYAVGMVTFVIIVFDRIMAIPWPQTLLGQLIPALKGLIPSV